MTLSGVRLGLKDLLIAPRHEDTEQLEYQRRRHMPGPVFCLEADRHPEIKLGAETTATM